MSAASNHRLRICPATSPGLVSVSGESTRCSGSPRVSSHQTTKNSATAAAVTPADTVYQHGRVYTADATDRTIHRLAEPRATNARGAAFLAFADLGMLRLDDVPSLLQVQQVHQPRPEVRLVMQAALDRLVKLHPAHALT